MLSGDQLIAALIALAGWIALGLILCSIAWFASSVLNYKAKVEEDYARDLANADYAWGDIAFVPEGLRPVRRNGGGGKSSEQNERADTHTDSHTLTRHVVHGRGSK
jgi:hypothetical protein